MIANVIAFYLPGNIPIYAYSLIIAIGILIGLWWISQQGTQRQAASNMYAVFWALIGAVICGRTAYLIVNWEYFRYHPFQALQIQSGGLAWAGALIGGFAVLMLYAILRRQKPGELFDAINPLIGVLAICAWIGCWFAGCSYGAASNAWWGILARDEWGQYTPRFPLQLIAAALVAMLFWTLERYAGRKNIRPGTLAGLSWLGLCILLMSVSLLRADPAPFWRGLRLETWAGLAFVGLSLAAILGVNIDLIREKLLFLSAPQPRSQVITDD